MLPAPWYSRCFVISVAVTLYFHANVDAQGGAYATGVLVLMTSAAVAVAIAVRKEWRIWLFGAIAVVFVYTTGVNMVERPEGLKISSLFIGAILFSSFVSRAVRSTELRITKVDFDAEAESILSQYQGRVMRLVARRLTGKPTDEFPELSSCIREAHHIPENEKLVFLEAEAGDTSDFDFVLCVQGRWENGHPVLRTCTPSIPNAFAAVLIDITKRTDKLAHIYFTWPEGNPLVLVFRFLFFGDGYTAPMTHEILREAVPTPERRPLVHVV